METYNTIVTSVREVEVNNDLDYTDPKVINQAVLEKLYVIGQDIFENYVQIDKEGSYTALHLYNP